MFDGDISTIGLLHKNVINAKMIEEERRGHILWQ